MLHSQSAALQGKALTASSRGIYNEFAAAAEALSKIQYDPLDVKATQFEPDYQTFCKTVAELERRTSAIISQVPAQGPLPAWGYQQYSAAAQASTLPSQTVLGVA